MIYNYLSIAFKNIAENFLNVNFVNDLKKLGDDINNLFENADKNIKNILLKKKIKTREGKINFKDVLYLVFNCSLD